VIPELGPECDICADPAFHYLLRCPNGHEWDDHAASGEHECPDCGQVVTVSDEEALAFDVEKVGLKREDSLYFHILRAREREHVAPVGRAESLMGKKET
jgi:hypothetical protein